VVLGLALGSIFLYLSLQGISWPQVGSTISHADLRFLGLALVLVLINLWLKIIRWNLMLIPSGFRFTFTKVSTAFISAQFINSLVPLRLGEISRVVVISRSGADPGFVLGTILGEKFLDVLGYIILLVILLLSMPLPYWIENTLPIYIVITLLVSLILILLLLNRNSFIKLVTVLTSRFSEQIRSYILERLHAGFASLAVFQRLSELSALVITTTLIWITALLLNQVLFAALDLDLPLKAGLLSLVAVLAGLSLPSLPGKIGIFEYASILALSVFGLDRSTGLSYGILLHIVAYLPVVVLGLYSFFHLQFRDLRSTVS
jgi:uncharacterized protein (TIRG00374 family)